MSESSSIGIQSIVSENATAVFKAIQGFLNRIPGLFFEKVEEIALLKAVLFALLGRLRCRRRWLDDHTRFFVFRTRHEFRHRLRHCPSLVSDHLRKVTCLFCRFQRQSTFSSWSLLCACDDALATTQQRHSPLLAPPFHLRHKDSELKCTV
jgi:hypothetical protein